MKNILVKACLFVSLILFLSACQKEGPVHCISPDGKLWVDVSNGNGQYTFSLILEGDTLVRNSAFGIELDDEEYHFSSGLHLKNIENSSLNESYEMKVGKRLKRQNNYNQVSLDFENEKGNSLIVDFRLFNDAVAYRYRLGNKTSSSVKGELSSFLFNSISNIWSIPYSSVDERTFTRSSTTANLKETTLSFPILLETKSNKWVLISEADVSNYPLSSGQFKGNSLNYVFSNKKIAGNTVEKNFVSPWRVAIVGANLGTIVESCVVDHLAPATDMNEISWVEPGVTSFPWWGNNLANSYPDTLKKYFDLSAEMKWKYVEFDIPLIGSPGQAKEYWKTTPWIKDVVDYGIARGVYCYGWDDIKNLDTPEKRDNIFSQYKEFGVRGIKVDFINSYTQQSRKLVEDVIKDAAKYQLMLSFHGAQSPRGFARTYPHIVTFEAVKGAEYYLEINGGKGLEPSHNCILPFTRNVLGSMDYTPVAFSSKIRTSTMAHELALSVIFESGWQGICDIPEAYLNSIAKPFLTGLPATWDETKLLAGYPGEYCCIARRNGDTWYIAGINAGESRKVSLKLPADIKNKPKIYTDIPGDKNKLQIVTATISEDNHLDISMQKNGGFAFVLNN